jgi:hypothetical protein
VGARELADALAGLALAAAILIVALPLALFARGLVWLMGYGDSE